MFVSFGYHRRMRFLLLLLGLPLVAVATEPKVFSSGEDQVHLLELFSSEGCSSCPPAEHWLGDLREAAGLWRDFVPVSFHVNYWDRLGWKDRFASKVFTARQYAYSSLWRSESVYTPEFVVDGAEWRPRSSERNPTFDKKNHAPILTATCSGDKICRVSFTAAGDYEAHVALLGGGIVSRIKAGENDGRTLNHEFVVFAFKTEPLRNGEAELQLPGEAPAGVTRRSLAVWITRRGELSPIQATGGWLD
jgi:hypothetical protein